MNDNKNLYEDYEDNFNISNQNDNNKLNNESTSKSQLTNTNNINNNDVKTYVNNHSNTNFSQSQNLNTKPENEEKPYLILSDKQLKSKKRLSKFMYLITYSVFIIVGLIIFYMYRIDKYEFYINQNEVLIANHSSYQIELTPKNSDVFDYQNYKYESVNENVAVVDETGKVTAVGNGETEIKIKYKNGFNYKTIKVKTEDVENVDISARYDDGQIESEVIGRQDLNIDVTYGVDNPESIEVDRYGHVETPNGGGGTVVVYPPSGGSVEVEIPSEPQVINVENIELVENNISIKRGTSGKITARVLPENASNKTLTYQSDNGNVSIDSNGNITGESVGNSVITITSSNGKIAYCSVTVLDDVVKVTAIDLNPKQVEIKALESKELSAQISPSNATERELIWESSNSQVVSVSNGKITGISAGEAVITVKTKDGQVSESSKIIVKPNTIEVSELKLANTQVPIKLGNSYNLQVEVIPSNATDKKLTYTSNNDNITVDSTGLIKANKVGNSIITIKSNNGKSVTCNVSITESEIEVESISLNTSTLNMNAGDSKQIIATINPNNATKRTLSWQSSNTNVATVSNGLIVAKGSGQATITVKSGNGKSAVVKVNVVVPVTSLTITGESKIKIGDNTTYKTEITPNNATNKSITWSSSNANVATVDSSGKVTAKGVGTTKITAKSSNGIIAEKTITIEAKEVSVSTIKIVPENITLELGHTETVNLAIQYTPSNATSKSIKNFTSSNTKVATVDSNGKVTAKGVGNAIITATSANGKQSTCKVVVNPNSRIPTGITLNYTGTQELDEGSTLTLRSTLTPSTAVDTLTWKSSNTKVATVNNGVVNAISAGTTTITVTSSNAKVKAEVTIKVNAKPKIIEVTEISLNKSTASLNINETLTLTATIKPSNAMDKSVYWSSSNTNVATVDANGNIYAISPGTAIITASTNNGKTASCTVTVKSPNQVDSVNLNYATATIDMGKTLELKAQLLPTTVTNKTIIWTSSDSNIATVDANGKVTGINPGSVSITATVDQKSASCTVTVAKDQIHFIDIGFAGNATLIESNDKFVLIDAGDFKSTSSYDGYGIKRIDSYFTKVKYSINNVLKTGIEKIDAVVISHMHYDHADAMAYVITKYKPSVVYIKGYTQSVSYYNEIIAAANAVGSQIIHPQEKQEIIYGNFKLKFYNTKELALTPTKNVSYSENINSLVIMASLTKGSKTYLTYLPGDLEKDGGVDTTGISKTIASDFGINKNNPVDVYVAAHHGYYDNDSPDPDLQAVNNRDNAIKPLYIKNAIITNTMGWFCQKSAYIKQIGLLNIYNNLKNNNGNKNIYFSNATRVKITFTSSEMNIDGGEVLNCSSKDCSSKEKIHKLIESQGNKANKCTRTPY